MGERWITWRGRHLLVDNDGNIINQNDNTKRLDDKEYKKISLGFYNSLNKNEKDFLKHYTRSGLRVSYANDPNYQKTYRFKADNKKGYTEKKMQLGEAIKYNLDEKIQNEFTYWEHSQIKKEIKTMDNIFEKKGISLNKPMLVYRRGQETLEEAKKGFIKNGYISASQKERLGKRLPSGRNLGEKEFIIVVPPNMKFLPLYDVADESVSYQKEILLPRNLKYSYIKEENNKIYLSVDRIK